MGYQWAAETEFEQVRLVVLDRRCSRCGAGTYVKDYKRRRLFTLRGPCEIVSQMTHCRDAECSGSRHLTVAEEEFAIAPPWWTLGWDALAFIGQRRFVKHRTVPEIRQELEEDFGIDVSDDAVEDYVARYQNFLAARQRDPAQLVAAYTEHEDLVLTIDGLQPEKGHETLYVVRELNARRVWFAVPLVSASAAEVEARLLEKARDWAARIGKPIRAWMSDKEGAFVKGIAKVFPGVPHRYCQNHFLRDVARPLLEADSHAKVQMRRKVRGLRDIERGILERSQAAGLSEPGGPEAAVLEYCAAVRGVLNKNQGGPLDPPGLRMAAGLGEVRASIGRALEGDPAESTAAQLRRLQGCIDRGLGLVAEDLSRLTPLVEVVRQIRDTLAPEKGRRGRREARFRKLVNRLEKKSGDIEQKMAATMRRFEPGLFAGGEDVQGLQDNQDLERWFRIPKAHFRRIHGRKHAGSRLVVEGPSLLLALDAHQGHRLPFKEVDLSPYFGEEPTQAQREAVARRRVQRRARSRSGRPGLLAELESRVRGDPQTRSDN